MSSTQIPTSFKSEYKYKGGERERERERERATLPLPKTSCSSSMCRAACSCPLSSFPKRAKQTPATCAFLRHEKEKGELERRLNSCRYGWRRGLEPVGINQQKKEKPREEEEEEGKTRRRKKDILSNFLQIYLNS